MSLYDVPNALLLLLEVGVSDGTMNFRRLECGHSVDRLGLSHTMIYVFIFLWSDWNQVGAILVIGAQLVAVAVVLLQFHCLLDCVQSITIFAINVFNDLHASICLSESLALVLSIAS